MRTVVQARHILGPGSERGARTRVALRRQVEESDHWRRLVCALHFPHAVAIATRRLRLRGRVDGGGSRDSRVRRLRFGSRSRHEHVESCRIDEHHRKKKPGPEQRSVDVIRCVSPEAFIRSHRR